ncbi:MAG TPA: hypothetical protein VL133_17170, partial [Devosia sp.]|nr:hypothetical protein [Devosia sp.]
CRHQEAVAGTIPFSDAISFDPNVSLLLSNERNNAFTDSAGVTHAGTDLGAGNASAGGRLVFVLPVEGAVVSTYLGGYGDYQWSAAASFGSARAEAGINWALAPGASINFGLGVDNMLSGRTMGYSLTGGVAAGF